MSDTYDASTERYTNTSEGWFRRCGRSGLLLPSISLGCWHNFGDAGTDAARHTDETSMHASAKAMLFTAFDNGITHFDLANNYGPAPGAAESRVGRILKQELAAYRDELIISSKAGYEMWPGPYGVFGSRKYLLASLDQSLKRLQLDYVDIFYSHRPDPNTPLEETLGALDQAVRSGKALYCGISSYQPDMTREVARICQRDGLTRPIIHQPSYSMLNRWVENGLLDATGDTGMGVIPFCPLAQGLLTGKYLHGIPADSRAKQEAGFLKEDGITPDLVAKLQKLNDIAAARGQSLAQMALVWVLRDDRVTSALIGASRPEQITENIAAVDAGPLTQDQLDAIDVVLAGSS
ncbi:MAG: L-glyceraldehyde 3-phosphate reductase [Lentisphaerae bacterium]|jgi:L-glyceraldehyde 3-phosphate reductase|nr:L-glyceraldehyde 3-phosphate reductase [Lentisphaerota bacterium]MBT4817928.1 L-glyceraldehyde 3-phosphate reductase [Lentisphaerota bacterium]MBT5613056.1 L-glyceraldehyde 3-phosphate reductase [Lentisphaerota bacterium]MBT7053983.1 L-glyceraldehyde 3-phosphate reductase [Lentisphaerota bacterium]MBT7843784.1 L-glyceraldehyde 3-phosphate reductase [Lentisphaerota bacterium]